MRQLIYNLSIRGKILLGFFLVTAIFFVLGIFQYNSLEKVNQTNELITFAKDMNSTAAQIKYLIAKDMNVLRNFTFAKNEKELKVLHKEHADLYDKLSVIFANTNNITANKNVDALLRHNFRDTIQSLNRLYNNEFCVSFNEIYLGQKMILNPSEIKNVIRQKEIEAGTETIPGDTLRPAVNGNDANIEEKSKDYVTELKNEQKKHYQLITKFNGEIDKMLTIVELKSNGLINKSMEESSTIGSSNINTMIIFMLIGIVVSIVLAMYISSLIVKPLEKLMKYAKRLSEGELPEFEDEVYNDEVGQTAASIEQLTTGLQKTSDFAHAIGQGDFSSNYQPLSDKDVLGNSLLNMRKSLQNANREEKKRQSEDIQRNWTTEGQALFAEILRHHPENVTELADDIMVNLVKYIKANQGGIFFYQDQDPNDVYLELLSAYAYNRKKFIKKKIHLGEGLVGSCAQEKYTIYLTDIPDDYIEIESGIGSANPKSLLIVPLKIENDILGVIELASFNEMKPFEIELVEKIAESIAATLQTTRINTRTAELLEQSKNQTQAMKDQEEMMKQTIEEMQATQEDSMKREDDFLRELKEMEAINRTLEQQASLQDNEIENLKKKYNTSNKLVGERENYEKALYNIISAAIITTNEDGIIQYVNELFVDLLGYKSAEVIGRSVYTILGFETKETEMAKALQAEYGSIVNTKGRDITVKHKNGNGIGFWLTVTANIFDEKVTYTIVLSDLTMLNNERNKAKGFEEEMLVSRFELEVKTEMLENLLVKNKIELPSIDQEYAIVDYAQNKIGLNIIDSQTKKWTEHINKFYADFKRKAAPKSILQSLDELIDYTGYHFGFEDKYLKDFNYSKYDEFKQNHDTFMSTLQTHRAEYAEGENIAIIKAIIFIKSWMSNYKDTIDAEFISLFKSHGLS
ncbi:MAG: GAF domain-containing protein [Bacteroidales bacterium]|nr:GAF domain-containing protein [Bacteroidales bacterium]MBR3712991.1 GAF domain-containing protein [Bacteroidales bacterium]